MTFAAGLIAGIVVVSLGGLFVFQARVIGGTVRTLRPDPWRAVAVVSLIISIVALARSADHGGNTTAPVADTTTAPPATAPPSTVASSTTSTTAVLREVSVPNVVGMAQAAAIEALQRAGLRSHIEPLPLASVPAGFVVTQTPIALSTTTSGAIVQIGVSAGA